MTANATASSPSPQSMQLTLSQLREESVLHVLPGVYTLAAILVVTSSWRSDPVRHAIPSMVLFLAPVAVVFLRRRHYRVAAWVLVLGCLAADALLITWSGEGAAVVVLALPAGMAALLLSLMEGVLTATASTLLLAYAPVTLVPADGATRLAGLVVLWGTLGLIWLTSRPLLTATGWFWFSYEQNRRLLEQTRDDKVQLKQTLEDLADANLQLTHLNRFADAMRQLAEDARHAKEQFVANVSHELRTPLNMIIGFCEMIVQAPQIYGHVPASLLSDLVIVLRNSQHLSSLIDDVLDLSQMDAGQMALSRERVKLREIVDEATAAVRPLFDSKKLYLRTDVPEDVVLFCDHARIRQVVLNLLSNAGRFTERGGVEVAARLEGGDVVVSIADTGPGIAAEDQSKLFRPFQQLDGSIRQRHGGSGLGLSISRNLVELHGGKMWLQSERGAGTTFFFRLPLEAPPAAPGDALRWLNPYSPYQERQRRSLAPPTQVRARFVTVEAGNALHLLLNRYLGDAEVVAVADLDAGLAEIARVPCQALLVNTPSAGEALQLLSDRAALPYGIPAIVCSIPDVLQAAGAVDYLVKPVSREDLLAALDRLNLQEGTVLLVDDEVEALRLFRRMLATSGRDYRVLRASDGSQALSILHKERPAVVLLDLVMPNMDGFQLLAAMAQSEDLRDIPAIVVSARDPAGQPVVSKALAVTRAGGFSMQQLLAYIETVSGVHGVLVQPEHRAPPERLRG